jgi:two-component system response regulator MprA
VAVETPPRIVVIEDNPELLGLIRAGLSRRGFDTTACLTGNAGLAAIGREHPDLVVLDLILPDIDGMDICRRLHDAGGPPVLILTSRDALRDRVDGLRAGAADYLVKPFAMEELAARIEAVLRRQPARRNQLVFDDLVIEIDGHRVTRGGVEISLTAKEFQILELLVARAGKVVTRALIAGTAWTMPEEVDDNLLDAHMSRLRQKLEAGGGRRLVHTVRGVGFVVR